MIDTLFGSAGYAAAQSDLPAILNIGFKGDNNAARTECGIGALMPWAEALHATTYDSSHGDVAFRLSGSSRSATRTRAAPPGGLEVHDLAVSKLVACREKDLAFVRVLLRERMVTAGVLREGLEAISVPGALMGASQRLRRLEQAVESGR